MGRHRLGRTAATTLPRRADLRPPFPRRSHAEPGTDAVPVTQAMAILERIAERRANYGLSTPQAS